MAYIVDLPRLSSIINSDCSPLLMRWALSYGCAIHRDAAGQLALEAVSAAEKTPDIAEEVVAGLARTFEAWSSEERVAGGLRKLVGKLYGPPLAHAFELVARQEGERAREFLLEHLDGDNSEHSSAVVPALRWIDGGRDILMKRLGETPRPDFEPSDVLRVLLSSGAPDEGAVRTALEFIAEAEDSDVCSNTMGALLDAPRWTYAGEREDLGVWVEAVVAECAPVVDEPLARRAADEFEEGNDLLAAEILLERVPPSWVARGGSGDTGEAGLARTILAVISGNTELRELLSEADGRGLMRLIAACISRVLDEDAGPESEPDTTTLEEAVRALSSNRPRIRNQEAWINRAASFGEDAVGALGALLESGPSHAADRASLALARTGTSKALHVLMEAANRDGKFAELAAIRLGVMPQELLEPFDAKSLELAIASGDWELAKAVLERWREAPPSNSGLVAEVTARHLERLSFEGDLVDAAADVLRLNPRPEFIEPVWALWRPGEPALGRIAEVLLSVHDPEGAKLADIRRDFEALRSEERLKDTFTGRLITLRLKCCRCGAAYCYDARDLIVIGAVEHGGHLTPSECVIINDVVKCKRCGSIDDYSWTKEAEHAFLMVMGAVMHLADIAGPERGREVMQQSAVTHAQAKSTVGENLPHGELISRLRSRLDEAPDDPQRHLRLGNAFFQLRRLGLAASVFSEAVGRWPDDVELQFQYGNVLERQERLGEALEAFSAAARALSASTPKARDFVESLAADLRDLSRRLERSPPADILDRLGRLRASLPPEKPQRTLPRVGGSASRPRAAHQPHYEMGIEDDDSEVTRPIVRDKKIGANAPCPCGSGRKYKKCCARKGREATVAETPSLPPPDRARRVSQKLTRRVSEAMSGFLPRGEFRHAMSRWRGESVPEDTPFTTDETGMMQFNEYLIHDWRPDGGQGRTVLERFLERCGRQLTAEERAQVEAWIAERRRGWFEVEEVDKTRSLLTLVDSIEGGVVEVYDVALASSFARGDMFLAAVFPVGERFEAGAIATSTPRNIRRHLDRWLRREYDSWSAGRRKLGSDDSWRAFFSDRAPDIEREVTRLCETPPCIVLSTGEDAAPGHAVYEVLDRRAAIEALESTPELLYRGWSEGEEVEGESYGWVHRKGDAPLPFERPTRDGDNDGVQTLVIGAYLKEQAEDGLPDPQSATEEDVAVIYLGDRELEVQALSKERLDYVRCRVATRLGGAARELRIKHRDSSFVNDLWERRSQPRGMEVKRRDPQLDELDRDFHARHLARWVDDQLPALGGKTPREAARDPVMRAELEAVLRDMEDYERRDPDRDVVKGGVARIRRELGMEPS